MDEMTDPGTMSAVLAYLSRETGDYPMASKRELEQDIGLDTGYELLYLRDREMVKAFGTEDGELFAVLKPEAERSAERLGEKLAEEYDHDYREMARNHEPVFIEYPEELEWNERLPTREELEEIGEI